MPANRDSRPDQRAVPRLALTTKPLALRCTRLLARRGAPPNGLAPNTARVVCRAPLAAATRMAADMVAAIVTSETARPLDDKGCEVVQVKRAGLLASLLRGAARARSHLI